MLELMMFTGAIIVAAVIYLLAKGHEVRAVLIGAGILMAFIGGAPLQALDAFAKNMTNAGLIKAVCSCMGFAMLLGALGRINPLWAAIIHNTATLAVVLNSARILGSGKQRFLPPAR